MARKCFWINTESSVWNECGSVVVVVWVTMLALANRRLEVRASIPRLAKLAHVSVEQCEDALARLSAHGVTAIDGGWRMPPDSVPPPGYEQEYQRARA